MTALAISFFILFLLCSYMALREARMTPPPVGSDQELIRRQELDIAEPIADVIRRAEQRAEIPTGHAEFNITISHNGVVIYRQDRVRFAVDQGVLRMLERYHYHPVASYPANTMTIEVRESVSDVVLSRGSVNYSNGDIGAGHDITIDNLTMGLP